MKTKIVKIESNMAKLQKKKLKKISKSLLIAFESQTDFHTHFTILVHNQQIVRKY